MKEAVIGIRNRLSGAAYRTLFKKVFFRLDPERVHDGMTKVGRFLGSHSAGRKMTSLLFGYGHEKLRQTIRGIHFPNPIGLSAGFDKNALLTGIMPHVGFGFMEVGSITGEACQGNPKPRLWRLPKSRALVVNYGLKNDGCEAIARRLAGRSFGIPVGISVAKTNCAATAETEAGVADYAKAFKAFADIGDYFTVNISCPNAYGGQPFTDPEKLDRLLDRLDGIATEKPVFLKLPPDLPDETVEAIVSAAGRHRVHGYVCTNLTKNRANAGIVDAAVPDKGGISGKVVEDAANAVIARVRRLTGGKAVIIGCGGVFTAEDAYRKIKLGASLIQLITGMIFRGPQAISEINQGLVRLLENDGFGSISEAVGADHRA